MGVEEIYADLEAEVSEEEFREAVEAKVEQMGGLADEETAAMLVAHEFRDEEVAGIADIEAGMEEAKFLAEVVSVGDLREFERDDGEEGQVLDAEVADETGSVRVTFWEEQAVSADEELEAGQTLRVAGRPQEGYGGVELSVDRVEPAPDEDVEAAVQDTYRVEDLALGLSEVTLQGRVLATEAARSFDRDDGSEGRVANLLVGDETGRVRVTLWDERAGRAEELSAGDSVEISEGYVREREDDIELHVGSRGRVETVDEEIVHDPDTTAIAELELGDTVDIAGVVRSADPKRTFDRDDGSEGQVRNVRIQDDTGDIRVALWGEKADADVGPGDELLVTDAEIEEGWQDDIEASAGWRGALLHLSEGATADATPDEGSEGSPGLEAFTDGSSDDGATGGGSEPDEGGEHREFTGVVVQEGTPVILDDGERTVGVDTDTDIALGEEVTVAGTMRDGRLDAEEVSRAERARAPSSVEDKD